MKNSKSEYRNLKQYLNPKHQIRNFWNFGLGILTLFRISDFVLRASSANKGVLTIFIFAALTSMPFLVYAQVGLVPCGNPGQDPCTVCDFGILIINITKFLIYKIAVPLAGLMIVIAGFMITLGGASESRVTAGKKILTNAIIGIAIVFLAWLAVDTTFKVLTGSYRNFRTVVQDFGPWNEIPSGKCPF